MAVSTIYGPVNMASPLWVQGFLPSAFTTTTMTYNTGAARAYQSGSTSEYAGAIQGLPGSLTLNSAVIGAGGCYPNAISSITPTGGVAVALVYACWNSSGTSNGSLSASTALSLVLQTGTTNYIPPQFDSYQVVGLAVVNSSGQFVPYAMNGPYMARKVMLQDAQLCLNAGALVGPTAVPLQLGANGGFLLSKYISEVNLLSSFTNNTADDTAFLIPTGLTSATQAPVMLKGSANTVPVWTNSVMPVGTNASGQASVNYSVSATDCTLSLYVAGFTFHPAFYAE